MNVLTKKIPTVVGLLLLVAAIVGGIYLYRVIKPRVATGEIPTKVKITNQADNKFSVSWVTTVPTLGGVQYGAVGDKLSTKVSDDRDAGGKAQPYQTHHVTLTGLQPSTQYAFRILSGDKQTVFDNNGSPYSATTGPLISNTPLSKNFYGTVQLPSKQPPGGAIVYLSLPGATTASTLVTESGNYVITLSTIRSSDLKTYASFDPAATVATVNVDSGSEQSTATVSLANAAPVPVITLGQNADFRNQATTPAIAQVQPAESSTPSASAPTTPGIFNVEPLSGAGVNAVTTTDVTLLNPASDGESLATLRPEFRGTGPAGLTLSIALTGQKAISDTTSIGADGTWTWSPVIDLKTGKQTITVSYVGTAGTAQKISRSFTISSGVAGVDPAFVSSPSASTKAKASATPKPTPSTRVAMPATDSGMPVTGVMEPTLLTGLAGVVIMVVGATLLAL
jgi:hypothetical protein